LSLHVNKIRGEHLRVLITEDNNELAEFIQEALSQEGYLSDIARNSYELKLYLREASYVAIILDFSFSNLDVINELKILRQNKNMVSILILTTSEGGQDKIKRGNYEADGYLFKPFTIEELTTRLKTLLWRPNSLSNTFLESGNVKLDVIAKAVTVDNKEIVMGIAEVTILEAFMWNKGLTVSKESLEDMIYQDGYTLTDNTLQMAVHKVRKKLFNAGATSIITTIRGIGYLFK
jgi:DNA-binding response OmpR family regulator